MEPWAVGAVAFLGTALTVLALVYAFSSGKLPVSARLSRLWHPAPEEDLGFKEKVKEQVQGALSGMGKLWPSSPKDMSRAQRLMFRAGFRKPEAVTALEGAKILVPVGLLSVVYFTGAYLSNPVFFLAIAAIGGYLLPDLWLTSRIRKRQQIIRLALPDALDLLVICVEAGLALDQALMRVAQELRFAHSELCDELEIVNNEMRVGKSRLDALRDLATRTGVDDLKALVAMLIQTDRFGTSVAQSLRVHSEQLRTMRRQRAEEQAAKTTVKMIIPLVLFVMPSLIFVTVGPAVIQLVHILKAK